jgi:chromosome segregation ATPase
MAKTTYSREELERQLSESRREFWAVDVTINNLELRLAEMAAHLANAENKRREIAAENKAIKFYLRNGPVVRKGGELVAAHQFSPETPATDAFLAEIERKAIRKFINSIEHILRDKLSPYDTKEMLEAMRIFLEEQE